MDPLPAVTCHRQAVTRVARMTVDISARLAEVMPGIRRDLEDLVRIQSVSADPDG